MKYRGVLLFCLFSILVHAQNDSIIVSEIMFYPVSGNNEFIELYNLSSAEINLLNYKIRYYSSSPDTITDAGYGTLLAPHQYAVILEGDYDFANGIYKNIIPESALILKINNNSFGSSGMANTTSRPVWLLSPTNDSLDFYFYSANNSAAISDEKIILNHDTSSANWRNSFTANGTPGFRNSVMQYSYDLQLSHFYIDPANPAAGDNIVLTAEIINTGTSAANEFIVNFYNDADSDSIPSPGELISSENMYQLDAGDSVNATAVFFCENAGSYNFIADLQFTSDENIMNNRKIAQINVYPVTAFNSVIINEIMYAPQNSEPEWVEVYNNSTSTLNLKNWYVGDALNWVKISSKDLFLSPGAYRILTKDSSIINYYPFRFDFTEISLPSLNNTGDALILIDSTGRTIDSTLYSPEWGGLNDRSLERINPSGHSVSLDNWGSSINLYKATPGLVNSLSPKRNDLAINSIRTNCSYAVPGELIDIIICVKNMGREICSSIPVNIYRDVNADSINNPGEQIKQIIIPEILPGDSLFFVYRDAGFRAGINYYIAALDFDDEDSCNNKGFISLRGVDVTYNRGDIVINEIMHSPYGEPEWIEIYNRKADPIDLKNFRIADASDTVFLTRSTLLIASKGYAVISSDSILLQKRKVLSPFCRCSMPALNNTGDKIILLDSLGRVIDSLFYSPEWGGENGYSIEKINPAMTPDNKDSWASSICRYSGTAGYINSVSIKNFDIELARITMQPENPSKGDTTSLNVLIKNRGTHSVWAVMNLYTDINHDSIKDQLIESSTLFIHGNDSVKYIPQYKFASFNEYEMFYAEIFIENDEDTSNNYCRAVIYPGYPRNSIAINEVMYYPSNGESEWIELYNRSNDTINLKGWKISDILTSPSVKTIGETYFFSPKSFLVIAADSSVLKCHHIIPADILICSLSNLNNDVDGVILLDNRNVVIDSMFYRTLDLNNRNSLERVSLDISSSSAENWNYSVDYESSTPGRVNSVTLKNYDLTAGRIEVSPGFPVKGDTLSLYVPIKNPGKYTASGYECIFFLDDSIFANITGPSLQPGDSAIIYCPVKIMDFTSSISLGFKIYFAKDEDTLNNFSNRTVIPGEKSGSVVINEIMFDPPEGCSEWIELFNPSPQEYNLKNWQISDLLPSPVKKVITQNDFFLNPGEYAVIGQDSSILNFYPAIPKFLTAPFGSLSSAGDGIILYDFRGGIIDSIKYKSGFRRKASIEKVDCHRISSDSSNWMSSLSARGCTPCEKNSVTDILPVEKSSLVINEIMYDPAPGNCEFIELYNRSTREINIGGWRIMDQAQNYFILSDTNFYFHPGEYFVFAADSSIMDNYPAGQLGLINFANSQSLGLLNSGESIIIKDINGTTSDSLFFNDHFQNRNFTDTKNRSIERISPEIESFLQSNWSSCTSQYGATPGEPNSIFTSAGNNSGGISFSPNPFSPDNDGWEDFAVINYNFSTEAPQVRMKIFDSSGRQLRTLADNLPSGSRGSLIFDGRDDEGKPLRIGIYILYIEASGLSGTETHKIPFVIARKL